MKDHDTLSKLEAGCYDIDYTNILRFLDIPDHIIAVSSLTTSNPESEVPHANIMDFIQHPKMDRLFILDRAWYSLITDDMLKVIEDRFHRSYEADKKAILEGKMRGGNVLSRTDEILDRIYKRAIVLVVDVTDNYARCAIIRNMEMNLEYNDAKVAIRIFVVDIYN